MDTTIFLAQFWGWLMVIAAVVYLVRGNSFLDELLKMHEDKGFIFLTGWILLFMGLVTIILHNVWSADLRIIITIAGWAAIFKGVTRIGFPKITQKLITAFFRNKIILFRMSMIVVGLLGAWLIYMSLLYY